MRVFYAVRLFLGLISVITDTVLVVALSRKYGRRLASYALAMLCLTSGCFFASTSEQAFSLFFFFVFQTNILVSVLMCLYSFFHSYILTMSKMLIRNNSKFFFFYFSDIQCFKFVCRFFAKLVFNVCRQSFLGPISS